MLRQMPGWALERSHPRSRCLPPPELTFLYQHCSNCCPSFAGHSGGNKLRKHDSIFRQKAQWREFPGTPTLTLAGGTDLFLWLGTQGLIPFFVPLPLKYSS